MKRVRSSPSEVIDLTDTPPKSKVAKTSLPYQQLGKQRSAPRPFNAASEIRQVGSSFRPGAQKNGEAGGRYFDNQRQEAAWTSQSGHYNDPGTSSDYYTDNLWPSFPGPEVFSHPSQRFRVCLNPDPDYFTFVAEELARSLPVPNSGGILLM